MREIWLEARRGEVDKKKIPNCPRYIFLCVKIGKVFFGDFFQTVRYFS